ncbi:MAG: ribosome silencing factor [Pseudomonadales bacterium]
MTQVIDLKELALEALDDLKAKEIVALEVGHLTGLMDSIVIATGTSGRHVKALANSVIQKAKDAGHQPLGIEGQQGQEWILVDLGDVVVHVMQPETRAFYDLERLWRDTPDGE